MGWMNSLLNGLKVCWIIINSLTSNWQLAECSMPRVDSGVCIFQYLEIWMITLFENDTKLVGVAGMMYGKASVPRDLERLKDWAVTDFMKLNIKWEVVHLRRNNTVNQYSLWELMV